MPLNAKGKKRTSAEGDVVTEQMDLFKRGNSKSESSGEVSDTTDSEESEYSGLEEEEDSDSISVESFEEASVSGGEGSDSEDDEEDEDEKEEEDDEEDNEDEEEAGNSVDTDSAMRGVNQKQRKQNMNNNKKTLKVKIEPVATAKSGSEKTHNLKQKKQTKSKALQKGKSSKKDSQRDDNKAETEVKQGGTQSGESASNTEVKVNVPDEYEYDSSDEEDLRNTVGNIPMEWYKEYKHIGYNLLGQKIIKPEGGDQLQEFINKMDDPNYWRTVRDTQTGQKVILSDKDAELVKWFRKGKFVDPNYDPYQPWIDFFTHETMMHPLTNHPATKRSFIPSLKEKETVGKMLHSIKMGWMKPQEEKTEEEEENEARRQHNYYMLWRTEEEDETNRRFRHHIPAPKMALPGHEESYNPPPEYLLTEEEQLVWKDQDPEDRKLNFLPKKFSSLRQVPSYSRFVNERFERCLDLYLCPRQRKMRMNVDPEDLIPKLPKPKELQPFPTTQAIVYRGHENIVRGIGVSPTGQWLVSGSDDETLKFWEVSSGRCMRTLKVKGPVKSVAWNPNPSLCLVAAVVDTEVMFVNPQLGDCMVLSNTDNVIGAVQEGEQTSSGTQLPFKWQVYEGKEWDDGFRVKVTHPKVITHISWHSRGDYLSAVMSSSDSLSVLIHQVSKRRSQAPFRKAKGLVQCVAFHPTRPFLFVATQRYVRVYNLLKLELMKKLASNVQWVSSIAVHPGGDNLILGSYDVKLAWFDLDLSSKPYQMLRHHRKAIRQVCFHKKYPLFASASDDGTVIICHGMVYNDLLQNPLLVPVKVLRGHEVRNNIGVLDCQFHPTQPWVFSSGADHTVRLFT